MKHLFILFSLFFSPFFSVRQVSDARAQGDDETAYVILWRQLLIHEQVNKLAKTNKVCFVGKTHGQAPHTF